MSISDSCKAYERFHSAHYQDEPFPMSKSKLIRYIKFRARSGTFTDFLTNLDQHPKHGPAWLQEMNSDPDVRKLMDLTINLWPRIAKQCKLPLIGVGNVYKTPSFEQKYGKYIRDKVNQEAMYRERVHVVEGKKSRGFMVTDPTQTRPVNTGASSESPINLDHPTPSSSPIQRSKSTTTSNSSSTASKYTPSIKYAATSTSTSTSRTTTTTATYKSTSKYDPKIDEDALREELMQQMMMPDQKKLVSQFKSSAATKAPSKSSSPSMRSVSPSTPPSSKKEGRKSSSPAESAVNTKSKSAITTKSKPAATKKEPTIQKMSPTFNKKQSKKELWKLAQKVSVRIEKSQEEGKNDVLRHPKVKIVKRKPIHYGINDDIKPAKKGTAPLPKIRHPVVLIKRAPPRLKDPVVKIIKRSSIPYPQQHDPEEDEKNKEDQQERVNREEEKQDGYGRNKKQKRGDYLYDQNKLQIVHIMIKNHA
ncbi:hypothetical protein MAM1_0003d00339 [Mucor ambiguus]|uniref:Uncharacterized protein n=1 Tax=Mucor ambiguus TaxID=91626 RepID=A0A0C9MG23_9FUNG|nr:hypothetical protein MAM1_0003d00339 [Mucor ambiguus]